jgi:DNA-binding GntR family transcriptional regulator
MPATARATSRPSPAALESRPAESKLRRVEEARREIQRRIIHLEMMPGETFTEGDLAASLGMSKTPVREALNLLSVDGYVAVAPRIGYRVTSVTLRDVQDLFELRELLETEATVLAARRRLSAADVAKLESLAESRSASDLSAFLADNTAFHAHIARCSGNGMLAQMVEHVLLQHERLFRLTSQLIERSEDMVHEHHDLVAALVAGDEQAARKCVLEQLKHAQNMVFQALMSSESILDARIVIAEPLRLTLPNNPTPVTG